MKFLLKLFVYVFSFLLYASLPFEDFYSNITRSFDYVPEMAENKKIFDDYLNQELVQMNAYHIIFFSVYFNTNETLRINQDAFADHVCDDFHRYKNVLLATIARTADQIDKQIEAYMANHFNHMYVFFNAHNKYEAALYTFASTILILTAKASKAHENGYYQNMTSYHSCAADVLRIIQFQKTNSESPIKPPEQPELDLDINIPTTTSVVLSPRASDDETSESTESANATLCTSAEGQYNVQRPGKSFRTSNCCTML